IVHSFYFGEKKRYIKYVKRMVKDFDVLVNVCTQNPFTDILLPILNQLDIKKILYLHGMFEFRQPLFSFKYTFVQNLQRLWNFARWWYLYFVMGKYFKQYEQVIQLHKQDYAVDFFKKHYNTDSYVIENAAEDMFFNLSRDGKKNKFERYIISVSNYFENKNQEMILEAFYKSNINSRVGLVFIGSEQTEYYTKLIKLNEHLSQGNNKNVQFLYGISRKEIADYLKNAEFFVMASKSEKFPVSIVEAMASSIAFISTDVGCVQYLPGGIIVNNVEEMVHAMNKLDSDKSFCEKLAKKGFKYAVENLKVDVCITKFIEILRLR
ncbi:TPA: glycosyltransferase family 4 protein, partial [Streptococcus suis]